MHIINCFLETSEEFRPMFYVRKLRHVISFYCVLLGLQDMA